MIKPSNLLALLYFILSVGCSTTQTHKINTIRDTVTRVRLNVEQSYPQIEDEFSRPVAETVEQVLQGIGVQVSGQDDPYDATLTVWLRLTAMGTHYRSRTGVGGGYFYTGARARGRMQLAARNGPTVTVRSSHSIAPSSTTVFAERRPHGAPFNSVWPRVILDGLYRLWGTEIYMAALENALNPVRHAATVALTELGASAVEPLVSALNNESRIVRQNAARALVEIGDTRAVEPLIAALKDESETVRRKAAVGLREMGDARAVEPLIAALKDRSVRSGAAAALGSIGDARAVEPLIAALKDRSVRSGAAVALGRIGDARAVGPLIAVLEDENSWARRAAERALGKITEQDFRQDQDKWQQWWEENKDEMLESR